jgi:hypothetical protein
MSPVLNRPPAPALGLHPKTGQEMADEMRADFASDCVIAFALCYVAVTPNGVRSKR